MTEPESSADARPGDGVGDASLACAHLGDLHITDEHEYNYRDLVAIANEVTRHADAVDIAC